MERSGHAAGNPWTEANHSSMGWSFRRNIEFATVHGSWLRCGQICLWLAQATWGTHSLISTEDNAILAPAQPQLIRLFWTVCRALCVNFLSVNIQLTLWWWYFYLICTVIPWSSDCEEIAGKFALLRWPRCLRSNFQARCRILIRNWPDFWLFELLIPASSVRHPEIESLQPTKGDITLTTWK